jgi:polar amino acid transport system substrate-binding protein
MWTSRVPRPRLAGLVSALVALSLAAACSSTASSSETSATTQDNSLGTIEPGVLTVAIQPYAPYTDKQGDGMSGLDADIVNAIAQRLKLQVKVEVTDFAGMLAGVQSRRYDMTVGGIAWTAEREKSGLFTDPPYYSPPAMAVRSGEKFRTIADLEGRQLGTVEGYVWVEAIQAVPGATLRAFPDANGVFDDLGAGRLDVGFLDPLLVIAAEKERPELNIQTQYLTAPTADQVAEHSEYAYFQPYMTSFYLPKEAPKLEAAISKEIRAMYASGELTRLIEKYGGEADEFLKPSPEMAATRQGVDRSADWTPPSI